MVMAGHYYYSNHEHVDMIKVLGACNRNVHTVAILYAERFPQWYHSDNKVTTLVEQWLVDIRHLNP
jgi:hypothetical protein